MPPDLELPDLNLSEAEDAYLRSCVANYRSTPSKDKEDFRHNCVRYIMRERGASDHPYTFQFLLAKVRNWFQNHGTQAKGMPLPKKVHQDFSGKRIHQIQNEAAIRKSVKERQAEGDADDKMRLANWNASSRELWEELPEDDKRAYELLAEQWTEEGPEEAIKPILAEKRAPSWMRSVSILFWKQCNMPIFIYGMYKDSNGALHAAVYDTSNLWHEKDKSAPLLRNIPGWDQDFRRVAWTFFQSTLRPDLATPEALQLIKSAKRPPSKQFAFSYYDDGCPILVQEEDGEPMNNTRRQQVFRSYMRIHYSLAAGEEKRAVPWTSLSAVPEKFFADGMLKDGFAFVDPSHLNETMLIPFFKHVIEKEKTLTPEGTPWRFRFFQYESGSGDNKKYHPAVYNGVVTPAAPRRAKTSVTVPDFPEPPSPPPATEGSDARSTRSPESEERPRGSPLGAAVAAGLAAARVQVQAEKAARRSTPSTLAHGLSSSPTEGPIAVTRQKRTPATTTATAAAAQTSAPLPDSDAPWLTGEIDAADHETDYDSDGQDDLWVPPPADSLGSSDEEVEDFLNDDGVESNNDGQSTLPHVSPSSPPVRQVDAGPSAAPAAQAGVPKPPGLVRNATPSYSTPMAPNDVGTEAVARLRFLQALANDDEYVELLGRVHDMLLVKTLIRAQSPVFWATWGHKSANVPEAVHTSEKKARQLVQWITKSREGAATPADVQRFCIGVGITLRDLALIADADSTDIWPEEVPGFMARSALDASQRDEVLTACASAFVSTADVGDDRKGKGKAKKSTARRGQTSAAPSAGAVRRSTRAAARGM